MNNLNLNKEFLRVSENSLNFSQYSTLNFFSSVLLTEIQSIFTESETLSLIQI